MWPSPILPRRRHPVGSVSLPCFARELLPSLPSSIHNTVLMTAHFLEEGLQCTCPHAHLTPKLQPACLKSEDSEFMRNAHPRLTFYSV